VSTSLELGAVPVLQLLARAELLRYVVGVVAVEDFARRTSPNLHTTSYNDNRHPPSSHLFVSAVHFIAQQLQTCEIMAVAEEILLLKSVKDRVSPRILCVQARQAMGRPGLTPAAVLAPVRYGSPALSKKFLPAAVDDKRLHWYEKRVVDTLYRKRVDLLMRKKELLVGAGDGASGGDFRLRARRKAFFKFIENNACLLAYRTSQTALALAKYYYKRSVPVVAPILRDDRCGFAFAADLLRELGRVGLHVDISFLESISSVLAEAREQELSLSSAASNKGKKPKPEDRPHPAKWRHRDVILIAGCLPDVLTSSSRGAGPNASESAAGVKRNGLAVASFVRRALGARSVRMVTLFGSGSEAGPVEHVSVTAPEDAVPDDHNSEDSTDEPRQPGEGQTPMDAFRIECRKSIPVREKKSVREKKRKMKSAGPARRSEAGVPKASSASAPAAVLSITKTEYVEIDDPDAHASCLFSHLAVPPPNAKTDSGQLATDAQLQWTWAARQIVFDIATTTNPSDPDCGVVVDVDFEREIFSESELFLAARDLAGKIARRKDENAAKKIAAASASPLLPRDQQKLLVCVLRAGFFVHADVFRILTLELGAAFAPEWVRVSTYNKQSIAAGISGSNSSFLMDLDSTTDLRERDVVLLDDSIGRGRSMRLLCELLRPRGVRSVTCAALLTPRGETDLADERAAVQDDLVFGCPTPTKPVYARALPSGLGSDPFSKIGGYGNDAVTKYRNFPAIGVLNERNRDAVWSEDTISGTGIDFRLFSHMESPDFLEMHEECKRKRGCGRDRIFSAAAPTGPRTAKL